MEELSERKNLLVPTAEAWSLASWVELSRMEVLAEMKELTVPVLGTWNLASWAELSKMGLNHPLK
jgi:hypothetical protein